MEAKEQIDIFNEIEQIRLGIGNDSVVLNELLSLMNPSELEPIVSRLADRLHINSPLSKDYKKPEKDIPVKVYNIDYYKKTKLPREIELKVTFDPDIHDDFYDAVGDALDDYLFDKDASNFAKSFNYKRV